MEDGSVSLVGCVPIVIGASVTVRNRWAVVQHDARLNDWCRNCTALAAPMRGKDKEGNEVPLCKDCYNKLRLKVEFPKSNRAERRSRQRQLKKDGEIL